MPMLCKKFFIRQSVCCFVFGFILLFIPSGLTYLNGQQNRESEFITDLVSDIISLADDEASENLSISDDVTLPVKGATGDQTRITPSNSLLPLMSQILKRKKSPVILNLISDILTGPLIL